MRCIFNHNFRRNIAFRILHRNLACRGPRRSQSLWDIVIGIRNSVLKLSKMIRQVSNSLGAILNNRPRRRGEYEYITKTITIIKNDRYRIIRISNVNPIAQSRHNLIDREVNGSIRNSRIYNSTPRRRKLVTIEDRQDITYRQPTQSVTKVQNNILRNRLQWRPYTPTNDVILGRMNYMNKRSNVVENLRTHDRLELRNNSRIDIVTNTIEQQCWSIYRLRHNAGKLRKNIVRQLFDSLNSGVIRLECINLIPATIATIENRSMKRVVTALNMQARTSTLIVRQVDIELVSSAPI